MAKSSHTKPAKLPMKADDALAGEVSVRAKVDSTGLTVAGRSRALMAADQLLGALVGIPARYLEGVRRRNELRDLAKEQYLRADIAAAMQQVEGVSGLGQATMNRLLRDEYRKQQNREGVWLATEEQLSLPPPQSTGTGDVGRSSGDDVQLDKDWLHTFARYAENISNEELQLIWGRILAGEIRKPGSFSPSTLRVISELDSHRAQLFQKVISSLVLDYLVQPPRLGGKEFEEWLYLQDAGLLDGVGGSLNMTLTIQEDGSYALLGKTHVLRMVRPSGLVDPWTIKIVAVTRAGLQIASILPLDEASGLRSVVEQVKPQIIEASVGAIAFRGEDGSVSCSDFEVVYSHPAHMA